MTWGGGSMTTRLGRLSVRGTLEWGVEDRGESLKRSRTLGLSRRARLLGLKGLDFSIEGKSAVSVSSVWSVAACRWRGVLGPLKNEVSSGVGRSGPSCGSG